MAQQKLFYKNGSKSYILDLVVTARHVQQVGRTGKKRTGKKIRIRHNPNHTGNTAVELGFNHLRLKKIEKNF